jgi:hypothetical protein
MFIAEFDRDELESLIARVMLSYRVISYRIVIFIFDVDATILDGIIRDKSSKYQKWLLDNLNGRELITMNSDEAGTLASGVLALNLRTFFEYFGQQYLLFSNTS